jgi:non-heme chloroperoxidase
VKKAAKIAFGACFCLAALLAILVAGLVIFGTAKPPQPLSSVTSPFMAMDYSGLPAIERYQARDGAALAYRTYGAGEEQVAVLIHGSAGSSSSMHALALALQQAGITVYVPDLRGHGANSPHGDIAYIGQLDDDIVDFLRDAKPKHRGAKWTLLGFSSGGGFALRIAGGSRGRDFDNYILLSPFLRYDAPTVRTETADAAVKQVWTKVYTPRILGLSALNAAGIHQLDGLPVIAFAVPPNIASLTGTYSWRMLQNFQPHDDYMADIRSVSEPMTVFVGAEDQLFAPAEFEQVFNIHAGRKDIPVTILPRLGHTDMITRPEAIHAVVLAYGNPIR